MARAAAYTLHCTWLRMVAFQKAKRMSLFIVFAAIIMLCSAAIILVPLWQAPEMRQRNKIISALIFMVVLLAFAGGLYIYLGAPNIVMFTA